MQEQRLSTAGVSRVKQAIIMFGYGVVLDSLLNIYSLRSADNWFQILR